MPMKFDNTITLGNVLTAISMAALCAAAWANVNERISRSEQIQISLQQADSRHDADIKDIKGDIKGALSEIKVDIKELRIDVNRKGR